MLYVYFIPNIIAGNYSKVKRNVILNTFYEKDELCNAHRWTF